MKAMAHISYVALVGVGMLFGTTPIAMGWHSGTQTSTPAKRGHSKSRRFILLCPPCIQSHQPILLASALSNHKVKLLVVASHVNHCHRDLFIRLCPACNRIYLFLTAAWRRALALSPVAALPGCATFLDSHGWSSSTISLTVTLLLGLLKSCT